MPCSCFGNQDSNKQRRPEQTASPHQRGSSQPDGPSKGHVDSTATSNNVRSSSERLLSIRQSADSLPTLSEHPEEQPASKIEKQERASMLCAFPSNLLINASTMGKKFQEPPAGDGNQHGQRLSDANVMASYDSVLMETTSSAMGYDSLSMRSSIAVSNRTEVPEVPPEDEDYDNFGTPKWTIDPHDIFFVARNDSSSKVCRIGRGDHGPVYLGVWKEKEVAVKLSKQRPTTYKAERLFQKKVAQLYAISHPHIVRFFGACFWKGGKRCVALTEYMEKGSLTNLLAKKSFGPDQVQEALQIACAAIKGLAYLHEIGLVHGRVKASNILFNDSGQVKLAVPCLSTLLSTTRGHMGKTGKSNHEPMTEPPEVKIGAAKSMAGDMYCFGLILRQLLVHKDAISGARHGGYPSGLPSKISFLVDQCLDEDPESRPSARMTLSILKNAT